MTSHNHYCGQSTSPRLQKIKNLFELGNKWGLKTITRSEGSLPRNPESRNHE